MCNYYRKLAIANLFKLFLKATILADNINNKQYKLLSFK